MRAALMAIVVLGTCAPAVAQESLLDRRLHAAAPAAAVVWTPDGIANGAFSWRIAESAGVPVIFEASPLDYRDPAMAPQRFDLDGLTVREALDVLVVQDPRYRWEERDGTIVIRPIGVLGDPTDALNQRIAGVRGDQLRLDDVLAQITAAVLGTGTPPMVPTTTDSQEFTLDAPSGTVLDLLAAAARAHGGVMWSAPRASRGPDQSGFSIGFKTFAGAGAVMPSDAAR